MKKITIIGGTSGFGEWTAVYLKNNFGNNIKITITGRNKLKGQEISEKLGVKFSDDNINSVIDSDITILSVPIAFMIDTIKEVCPYLKKGSIVLDVTSIKNKPSKALNKYSPEGVLVIPTHPMFGPYISSIAGQIFIFTIDESVKIDNRYNQLKKYLYDNGAKVIETSGEEHDKMMAIVQGLTHFDMFVLGSTIKKLGVDVTSSLNYVSPIYKIIISSVARYLHQDPKLYSDIQMYNEEILKVHEVFTQSANEFNLFVKERNENKFIDRLNDISNYFGKNAKKGQLYTDKIIYLISKQIDKLEKNIGKKIKIKNIYNQKLIEGKLIKYEDDKIFFESGDIFDLNEYEVI